MKNTDFDYLLVATFMHPMENDERQENYRRDERRVNALRARRREKAKSIWRSTMGRLRNGFASLRQDTMRRPTLQGGV